MYHFIINPHSSSGRGGTIWKELVPILEARHVPYEAHLTRYAGHALSMVRELTSPENVKSDPDMVLVGMGGDGTIHEIVNGIQDPASVTLGYIPTGSGNDFARSYGISMDPKTALEDVLRASHSRRSNLCVVKYDDVKEPQRFAVSTGIGFDGAVCHGTATSRAKIWLNAIHMGKLVYLAVALKQLILRKHATITVALDDGSEYTFTNALFAAIMNVPYEGGGYKFCPRALSDDGYLDATVVHDISTLRFLTLMPLAFSGKHTVFQKYVFTCKCRTIRVETDTPLLVHADGELIQQQKGLYAYQEEGLLKVITGAE